MSTVKAAKLDPAIAFAVAAAGDYDRAWKVYQEPSGRIWWEGPNGELERTPPPRVPTFVTGANAAPVPPAGGPCVAQLKDPGIALPVPEWARPVSAATPPGALTSHPFAPPPEPTDPNAGIKAACAGSKCFTTRSWGEIVSLDLPPRRFFFGELFACGLIQVIFGQGGLGKSRLALNLARNQVLGSQFLGATTGPEPLRHLFLGSENDVHRWQVDMRRMSRGLNAEQINLLGEHIRVATLENPGDCFINLGEPANLTKWRETIADWIPDVLWVDPWGDVIEGDGFDSDVRSTLSKVRSAAGESNPDCGIVIMAHARTGIDNVAQATGFDAANFGKDSKALFSAARAVVNVAPYDASEHPDLVWVPAKNNNGQRPEPLRIRLDPENMTYSAVEPLNIEAWQTVLKEAKKTRGSKSAIKFDDDAVLGLAATLMTVTEFKGTLRNWNWSKGVIDTGVSRLVRTGQLEETSAGKGRLTYIGTPDAIRIFKNSKAQREV